MENSTAAEEMVQDVLDHDEFFQDKESAPVSEAFICKRILYSTVATSDIKMFDILLLIPSLLFLLCLIYTSPRSRQKMSGASNALVSLKFIILISTVFCLLRALLMTAIPTEKDSGNGLEKVTWTATRSSLMCLELTAILNLIFSTPPNAKSTRRLLACIVLSSLIYFLVTLSIELGLPSPAFHLFEKGYFLYGEGGGLYTAIISGILLALHTLVLSVRSREHKSSPGRRHALCCSLVLLVLHAVRGLGGLILLTGAQGGMCLTSVSLYVHTTGLGPLLFICLVSPFLQNGQGHSLLGYAPQINQWEEEERIVTDKLSEGASAGILRNENTDLQENEDDYQM